MGLDSYIRRTNRAEMEAYGRFLSEYRDNLDACRAYESTLKEKYGTNFWGEGAMTEDEKGELLRLSDRLVYDDCSAGEIWYGRKPWTFHQYVVENFCPAGEDDNCTRIVIPKEGLEKTVKWLESGDFSSGDGNYFDSRDAERLAEALKDEIARYKEDTVIYYYAWY